MYGRRFINDEIIFMYIHACTRIAIISHNIIIRRVLSNFGQLHMRAASLTGPRPENKKRHRRYKTKILINQQLIQRN
jgi:hypothetical protein